MAALFLMLAASSAAANVCALPAMSQTRAVRTADLASLRDIGGMADTEAPFDVSPDGRKIAFTVRQGDPANNRYCVTLYIQDIKSRKVELEVSIDGEPILGKFDRPPIADFGTGIVQTIIPRWSPDGEHLAFLRRQGGNTQIWLLNRPDGSITQLTHSVDDVRDFRWERVPGFLLYSTRTKPRQTDENLRGYRYDSRWQPNWGATPRPSPTSFQVFSVSLTGREERPAPERSLTTAEASHQRSPLGAEAWIKPLDPRFVNSGTKIVARRSDAVEITCAHLECNDVEQLWFGNTGRTLFFRTRSGWARKYTDIYTWAMSHQRPRLLLRTTDIVEGCTEASEGLICTAESSAVPRQLIMIDKRTGARTVLFDPNPHWKSLRIGTVTSLEGQNHFGLPYYAKLVLPPGSSDQAKLPLIVVGYYARGFLRGGVGDMYPIFPLASEGYAVLVYNRPLYYGLARPVATTQESTRIGVTDWMDKRSVSSAITETIDRLVKQGTVDPQRIGITGFSDGADKARFMLLHSPIFAAAAISSCCDDPVSIRTTLGPYFTDAALAMGYPTFDYQNVDVSREYSLAANADRVKTPILIQTADREYLGALESEEALRSRRSPIALYVFPDEYHNFWQPAHRLAVYDRSMAWFDFWLLKRTSGAPKMAPDIGCWRSMPSAPNVLERKEETPDGAATNIGTRSPHLQAPEVEGSPCR